MKGLPWEGDGRLKAPEEDAGVGVWGAKLRRKGALVILKSGTCPFHLIHSFHFSLSRLSPVAAASSLTFSNNALMLPWIDFLRHADAEASLFPHIPPQQMAEEDTKHTKGGLDLLT